MLNRTAIDWMLNRTVNWMNVEQNSELNECWTKQRTDWMLNRTANWLNVEQNSEPTECWTEQWTEWMLNRTANWMNVEQNSELNECWTEKWLNDEQRPNKPSADQRNVETGVSLRLEYLYVTCLEPRETAAVSVHILCTPHNHLPVCSAILSEVTYVSCMRV